MASSHSEIVVDRDGIPHFTGAQPALVREYRRRVLFVYNSLERSGDETKEARSLKKKRRRFARKLLDVLHGEAWKACQDLMLDSEKLKSPDGYKEIFKTLGQIEKAGVIRKTEAFDQSSTSAIGRSGKASILT